MAYYDQWFRVRPLSKGLYKQLKAFEKQHGVGDDQVVHFALADLFKTLSDHPDNQADEEIKAALVASIKAFRPGREQQEEEREISPSVSAPMPVLPVPQEPACWTAVGPELYQCQWQGETWELAVPRIEGYQGCPPTRIGAARRLTV